MTGQTIADRLRRERRASLRGRDREMARLAEMLDEGGPAVAYIHGVPGIGKSALLGAFEALLGEHSVDRLRIEAGSIEPRPEAIAAAVAAGFGVAAHDAAGLSRALALRTGRAFLLVDDVHTWRLAESWLRLELVPRLPASMGVVLAGATQPSRGWSDLGSLFMEQPLGPLRRADVQSLADGLEPAAADRVWSFSRGHPLAARLAVHAARSCPQLTARDQGEIATRLLDAIGDPDLRRVTYASAVVRRAARPLVAAILDDTEARISEEMAKVEALPFANRDAEGLYIVEPVRSSIVEEMSGLEPERYGLWRRRAADWITQRLRAAGPRDRWRFMADLLHLLDQPALRDAFFPPDGPALPVEPALPGDHANILSLTEALHGVDERRRIELWLARVPHRFNVVRNAAGKACAYYLHARPDDLLQELAEADPLLAAWTAHLADEPVDGEVLFVRQMLARAPESPERLACNLDLKRNYLERWGLARIYTCAMEEALAGPLLHNLGFRPLFEPRGDVPGSMVLDLPGADLIGWVSALVGATDAPRTASGLRFVRDRREVRIGEHVATLTRLEAEVLAALVDAAPAVVGRETLIETVWRRSVVGSNVVDTVIRTLRKKLGPFRGRIQTVAKAGYRYVATRGDDTITDHASAISGDH